MKAMNDAYLYIRCVIPVELEDELPELLAPWSVLGSEIGIGADDRIGVTIYLRGDEDDGAEGVRRTLAERGAYAFQQGSLEEDDWLAGFRQMVRPFEVGRGWWIDPHPDQPSPAPAGRRRLVVEPRTAFGSGTHESTRAILSALEEIEVDGRRVLDVGTGSGILALAAECLGAAWVVGLDIDPVAIWVASEVAQQQEWTSRANFILGSVDCVGRAEFDIVLCNMIASNMIPLLEGLRRSIVRAGVAVFSGLLASEVGTVSRHLTEVGFKVTARRETGDWASLTGIAAEVS